MRHDRSGFYSKCRRNLNLARMQLCDKVGQKVVKSISIQMPHGRCSVLSTGTPSISTADLQPWTEVGLKQQIKRKPFGVEMRGSWHRDLPHQSVEF